MLPSLLVTAFLLAHGAIHAGFIAPRPPVTAGGPEWPFDLGQSRVLARLGMQRASWRLLGVGLVAATVALFALAALAWAGFIPWDVWTPASAGGAIASLVLLLLFFHRWLVLGLLIDLGLLWAVLIAGWTAHAESLM